MAYCPSCGAAIEKDAIQCAKCAAMFDGDGWKPLDAPPVQEPPSRTARAFGVGAKIVLTLLSLAALVLGIVLFDRPRSGFPWQPAGVAAMIAVMAIAIRADAGWMVLVLLACVAFGVTSCFDNFHWRGG